MRKVRLMAPERTLDWRPNPDPRSLLFAVSLWPCFNNGLTRASAMRKKSVWLDQGQEGACTGFGAEHVRALSPYRQRVSNSSAQGMYVRAKFWDEWPGEDYEGSSVNGAMKAEREAGFIKAWKWCYSLDELDHALAFHGAVEMGSWWWSGMWSPDSDGILHMTGSKVGGHAFAVSGYRTHPKFGKQYHMDNSWGPDWGVEGGAWLSAFDMQQLLSDDGEIACPQKVRL